MKTEDDKTGAIIRFHERGHFQTNLRDEIIKSIESGRPRSVIVYQYGVLRYTFLDESFAAMYADVQRMGHIFTTFAILAIIIACLGLFALSAFMAEQRSKEIGIRKVLGASVSGIKRQRVSA